MLLKENFQFQVDGQMTDLFYLKNKKGTRVAITNFGARIVEILINDKNNRPVDIIIGPETLKGFIQCDCPYYGATIGRYANRIALGQFSLNENAYQVTINEGQHHLHGGIKGFHNVVWSIAETKSNGLKFHYFSKDQEEGYPGNLSATVQFNLSEENELKISYEAHCDKLSIVNLTNHSFFNLNGAGLDILDHVLQINADHFTPIDEGLIPNGEILLVSDTPFDFRAPRRIGESITSEHQQLKRGNGYDHNFVLNKMSNGRTFAAKIVGDLTGIGLEIHTTEPGLQFYSGNFMKGSNVFKNGKSDDFRTAFALETQHFPDSPHHAHFPSVILSPGEVYKTSSTYTFSGGKT